VHSKNIFIYALFLLTAALSARAQTVTPSPETGVTPNTLLLYRADLIPGKEAAYAQTEGDIVRAYANAKIPVYWLALQSATGSPHVLYFDGCDTFAAIEKAGTDVAEGLNTYPEIASLQQKLQEFVTATRTVMAFRRDDLSYHLNKIDLAKARYVRVTIFQLRPGYEDEFADAFRARARTHEINDIETPWMIYQVHSGLNLPAFLEFQPMDSLSEIDDALDREKRGRRASGEKRQSPAQNQKWMKDTEVSIEIQVYNVSLAMSYLSAAQSVAAVPTPAHPVFERNGGKAAKPAQLRAIPPSSYPQARLRRTEAAKADDESRPE
jgi:hypothetical protein